MKLAGVASFAITVLAALSGCQDRTVKRSPNAHAPSVADGLNESQLQRNPLVTWRPLAAAKGGEGAQFQRLDTHQTGVDFVIPIDTTHPLKRLYAGSFFCGGVAIGDVNNDELPDIYLVSGPGRNKLYCQTGQFKFDDVTDGAQVDGADAWGTGAAMIDFDNDGDLDIYVCNYDSPNLLYVNQGNCRFVESATKFGLDIVDCSIFPTFCDYDGDGDLDCYLLTNRFYREGGFPRDMKISLRNGQPHIPEKYEKYYRVRRTGNTTGEFQRIGRPDRLLRNDGSGRFIDVTASAGISPEPGYGLSANWWDYDSDGRPDLYVGNDYHDPDRLYHNNGDGTFTDVIGQRMPHTTWFSMGADVGDVNNDGLFDFLSLDMSATTHFGQKTTMGAMGNLFNQLAGSQPPQYMRNALYLNTGTERFMEVAYLSGLASTDWSWSVKLADLDNDGRVDAYITNGMTRNMIDSDHSFTFNDEIGRTKWDLYENLPSMPQQNRAYRNSGQLNFHDVSQDWGLDHVGMSFAGATGDFDRDGDLDLVVANLDEPVSIYENRSTSGHRVMIRLRGDQSNHWGVGCVVRIETSAGEQIRQLIPSTGYLASNEPLIHFGLGEETSIQRLTVSWPSGCQQSLENLPVDRCYTINESKSGLPNSTPTIPKLTLFRRSLDLADAKHIEKDYNDFARQPLLPNKLSQLGPGLAVGDVDDDGDDDLFLSGAVGQSGTLLLNQGKGKLTPKIIRAFEQDAACEDMASVFFDVDSDGDQDLYVVSGGVEWDNGDGLLRDRLYLNDGQGNFSKAPDDRIPNLRDSGGPVAACDFDRDGDLDLFVGGRVVPGNYPSSPKSRLLRNDGGRLFDITAQLAPDILESGMVTGALWSDANNDGWLDLLVTYEWGPIRLFQNIQGRLIDQTLAAGLEPLLGWWNGIAGRDLDGDGDMDYVVTNFGLNTKYHAAPESPALLFYGDFEGAGGLRLVEAEFEGGKLFPLRGKSCSSGAMPFLSDRFPTYKSFALASLEEIYSSDRLQGSQRFAATTLRSGALINDGDGRMEFRPLPNLAQSSPGFGIVVTEVNGDGNADVYLVQNFFSPQVETGRMDGGLSLLLQGNGDGTFEPVWPADSGLVVAGDAKSLAAADLNDDGRPDFLIGINNDNLVAYLQNENQDHRLLTVRLKGPRGNPTAVGARVTVRLSNGTAQTAEVSAGSGYLSQSTSALTFARGTNQPTVEIRWPDGSKSVHEVSRDEQVSGNEPVSVNGQRIGIEFSSPSTKSFGQ